MDTRVMRWQGETPPSAAETRAKLRDEPHDFMFWANGPAFVYAPHEHSYDKLLVCLRGGVTFTLDETGERVELLAGDRLYLPARTIHRAVVGTSGVECAEAHIPRR